MKAAVLLLLCLFGSVCHAAVLHTNLIFSPGSVVPPQQSTAWGIGETWLDTTALTLTISYTLTGVVGQSAAHVHEGSVLAAGSVLHQLPIGSVSSTVVSLTAAQVLTAQQGGLYIAIHTVGAPVGALRAQIAFSDVGIAHMTGFQQNPTVDSTAAGVGYVVVTSATTVSVSVSAPSLDGLTMSHIHSAVAGSNGGVVCTLPFPYDSSGGFVDHVCTLSPDQMTALKSGGMYFNLHTDAHPGGEIRGQIVFMDSIRGAATHMAVADASNVQGGASTSSAVGRGAVVFSLDRTFAVVFGSVVGSDPVVAAHIHGPALSSEAAGVLYTLPKGTFSWHVIPVDSTNLDTFQANPANTYFQTHTVANPGGDVRGQLDFEFGATETAFVVLNAAQQVAATTSLAHGSAVVEVDRVRSLARLTVDVSDLVDQTAGHLHAGPIGGVGDPLFTLPSPGSFSNFMQLLTPAWLGDLDAGNTYLNLHTTANPAGEIRAQVGLKAGFAYPTSTQADPAVPWSGDASATVAITGDFSVAVTVYVSGATPTAVSLRAVGSSTDLCAIPVTSFPVTDHACTGLSSATMTAVAASGVVVRIDSAEGRVVFPTTVRAGVVSSTTANADNVVPPVTSTASGHIQLALANDNSFGVAYGSVSGVDPLVAAHIHGPAAVGANAGVLVHLPATTGFAIQPFAADSDMVGYVSNQELYYQAHTTGGAAAIRGQFVPSFQPSVSSFVVMNSAAQQQGTPVVETSYGTAVVELDTLRNVIRMSADYLSLTGPVTAAHLHSGPVTGQGGALLSLPTASFTNQLFYADAALITALLNGQSYLNVHTSAHAAGEIRSQVTFETAGTAFLSGYQQPVPVVTAATGIGSAQVLDDSTVAISLTITGLTSTQTAAHVHFGDPGANGGVVCPLPVGTFSNHVCLFSPAHMAALKSGGAYLNVHTQSHPGGEIRGQILFGSSLAPALASNGLANGASVVPSVTTSATGSVQVAVSQDGRFGVVYAGIKGVSNPTAAHLHGPAQTGSNTGVLYTVPTLSFTQHVIPLDSTSLNYLSTGFVYYQAHTTAAPAGLIRGQLFPLLKTFVVLTGDAQRPTPVATAGYGTATLTLNEADLKLTVSLSTSDLSSAVAAVHIHRGSIHGSGAPVITLASSGTFTNTYDVPADFVAELRNGTAYLNVHTSSFAGGELRGQVCFPGVGLAYLSGQQQPVPVASSMFGAGTVSMTGPTTVAVNLGVSNPSAVTAVHLHEAAVGSNGGVVCTLPGGVFDHFNCDITSDQMTSLMASGMYINVHTAAHAGGEIRGQVMFPSMFSFGASVVAASLSGDKVVPPVAASPVSGNSLVVYSADKSVAQVFAGVTGTGGISDLTATAAHIHSPSGPVMYSLPVLGFSYFPIALTADNVGLLDGGTSYYQMHTDANPGGEVRGSYKSTGSAAAPPAAAPAATDPAGSAGVTSIQFDPRLNCGFTLTEDDITFDCTLDALTWLAIGVSTTGSMITSPPVTATIYKPTDGNAVEYKLNGRSASAITADPDNGATGVEASQADGKTKLKFTRALVPADSTDAPIQVDGTPTFIVFAYGGSNSFGFHSGGFGPKRTVFTVGACNPATTCSGHGTCNEDQSCTCDLAYGGANCLTCAQGFAETGTSACVAASATMAFAFSDGVNFGNAGTADRTSFETGLLADLAAVSAAPVFRFNVTAVLPVPQVARVLVSDDNVAPSVEDIVTALTTQARNAAGPLYDGTARAVTQGLNFDVEPVVEFTAVDFVPETAFRVDLTSNMWVQWNLIGDGSRVIGRVSYQGDAWIGFGVNDVPKMLESDVVIFKKQEELVAPFHINEKSADGIDASSRSSYVATAYDNVDGVTSFTFVRDLAVSGLHSIDSSGFQIIVWAHGSGPAFAKHSERGALQINFQTGEAKPAPRDPLHLAHGAMMFIGWGVLLPLGVLTARFTRTVDKKVLDKPLWFTMHRIIQTTGLLFAIIGFIIAIAMVDKDQNDHFHNSHMKGGLAVMILGLLQPLNALIRPHPEPKTPFRIGWEILHKASGYAAVVTAIYVIYRGLQLIEPEAASGTRVTYLVYGILLVVSWFVLEGYRIATKPAQPDVKKAGGAAVTSADATVMRDNPLKEAQAQAQP